jgi:hypothetical protein
MKNKIVITTLLVLTGMLVWKTKENWDLQDKILNFEAADNYQDKLNKELMYTSCLLSAQFICTKQVRCSRDNIIEIKTFCEEARR